MIKDFLCQRRSGFFITFEVMCTVFLVTATVSMMVYFAEIFQTKKYFANVASATCTMVARYGGNNSKAYSVQVAQGTIADNANKQIAYMVNHTTRYSVFTAPGGKYISVSDTPDASGNITVSLSYQYAKFGWGQFASIVSPGVIKQEFSVPTLIYKGSLV